jgi:hypothetical protein
MRAGRFLVVVCPSQESLSCGVDYAPKSYKFTIPQFTDAEVNADIRLEDFMRTSFE